MTVDERIEKLTERHEALAQSVDLMAAQTEENRKSQERTGKHIELLAQSIRDLVGVVRSHESRINGLESQ
jgi:hypothetical protein